MAASPVSARVALRPRRDHQRITVLVSFTGRKLNAFSDSWVTSVVTEPTPVPHIIRISTSWPVKGMVEPASEKDRMREY